MSVQLDWREQRYQRELRRRVTPHWVYRCFDSTGRLIYVGCTENLHRRLTAHSWNAWWAPQMADMTAELYPGHGEAQTAESHAIRNEHPRWNLGDRWQIRHCWRREDYGDFIYASLRLASTTVVTDGRIVRLYKEYEDRFGEPLRDSRIDDCEWPYRHPGDFPTRRQYQEFNRNRHLIKKADAA